MRSLRLALIVLLFAGLAAAQKHVSFPAPDGYRLRADLYGKGPRGIVLAHGGRFTMESWDKQARIFAKAGFRVLALDFRGYGQTIAGTQTSDDKTYPDVLAAVRYLHSTRREVRFSCGREHGWRRGCRCSARGTSRRDRAHRVPRR